MPTEGSNHVQLSCCYGAQFVLPPVAGAPFCECHETHSPAPSIPQFYNMLLSPLVGTRFVLHNNATGGHDWSPRWAQIVFPPMVGATFCENVVFSTNVQSKPNVHKLLLPPLVGARFVPIEGSNHVHLSRCYGAQIVFPSMVRATFCKTEVLMEQDCELHEIRKIVLPPLVGARFVLHINATAGHDWSPRWAQIVLPPVVGATICEN